MTRMFHECKPNYRIIFLINLAHQFKQKKKNLSYFLKKKKTFLGTLRLLLPTPTMTMSKGMVLCLCMFMLSGLLTSYTDAKAISYGAIGNGNPISCSKRGGAQKNCQAGAPANPYSRGCGKGTKCRHG